MATESKGKLKFILGFVAFFAALWFLWDTSLAYPLKIFVVLLHEISHAIASVATGGGIEKITLDPRQGGACYCFGGSAFITLTAGYLGSLFWGAMMFTAARSDKVRTDWVNGFIGVMVVFAAIGVLLWRMLTAARQARDNFTSFLAIGIFAIFVVQSVVNIGVNLAVLPTTGVALPLVSAGGTSLLISMILIGIVQSIVVHLRPGDKINLV